MRNTVTAEGVAADQRWFPPKPRAHQQGIRRPKRVFCAVDWGVGMARTPGRAEPSRQTPSLPSGSRLAGAQGAPGHRGPPGTPSINSRVWEGPRCFQNIDRKKTEKRLSVVTLLGFERGCGFCWEDRTWLSGRPFSGSGRPQLCRRTETGNRLCKCLKNKQGGGSAPAPAPHTGSSRPGLSARGDAVPPGGPG